MRFVKLYIALTVISALPMTASAYQLTDARLSPVGGPFAGANHSISASDMTFYGPLTASEVDQLSVLAAILLTEVSEFKQRISFHDCGSSGSPDCFDDRLETLLLDPDQNFETVGLIDEFRSSGIEGNLLTALEIYDYISENGSGSQDVLPDLRNAVRDLMTIYMVFADEFLIDALDFQFSLSLVNMDAYLGEQIGQLDKAVEYYGLGYNAFISVWAKATSATDQSIGQFFSQASEENLVLWDMFNLLCHRMSQALREKVSKEYALQNRPSDELESDLSDMAISLHLQSVSMAEVLGDQFTVLGGERILTALGQLQKQLADLSGGNNPLGYDERYVPLNDFDSLLGLANSALGDCQSLETLVLAENRDYDCDVVRVTEQQNTLNTTYMQQLAEVTGCSVNQTPEEFQFCVECSGGDLYDCSMDLDPDAFEACVQTQVSGIGILGAKYRQIKDADLNIDRARLQWENIGKRIDHENARVNNEIQIWKDYTGAQTTLLEEYRKKMKDAVVIRKVKSKTKVKNRGTGQKETKSKESRTEKSFTIRDDALDFQIWKEKELLELTADFQISMALNNSNVKNLMLEEAEALIGIDQAVHNKNTMLSAFDSAVRQKENLLSLWSQNWAFVDRYWQKRLPTHRIIRSDRVLQLTQKFNKLAHFCYLATKALEYKYMEEMNGVNMGVFGEINITDIFKYQTAYDFDDYLERLEAYNVMECPAGAFQTHTFRISLAQDVLGLTNASLGDQNGDNIVDATGESVPAIRYERFQEFVNEHIDSAGDLTFTFTNSVHDDMFSMFPRTNMKIWQGPVPCASGVNGTGLAASLHFRGSSGSILPVIYMAQRGSHTFIRQNGDLANYYPIKTRALIMDSASGSEPFTAATFAPFNGIDPRFNTGTWGEWTGRFTNRSAVATEWQVTLKRASAETGFANIPMYRLSDINIYMYTVGY